MHRDEQPSQLTLSQLGALLRLPDVGRDVVRQNPMSVVCRSAHDCTVHNNNTRCIMPLVVKSTSWLCVFKLI